MISVAFVFVASARVTVNKQRTKEMSEKCMTSGERHASGRIASRAWQKQYGYIARQGGNDSESFQTQKTCAELVEGLFARANRELFLRFEHHRWT